MKRRNEMGSEGSLPYPWVPDYGQEPAGEAKSGSSGQPPLEESSDNHKTLSSSTGTPESHEKSILTNPQNQPDGLPLGPSPVVNYAPYREIPYSHSEVPKSQ